MSVYKALILLGILPLLFLTGCGEKPELTAYKENMSLFYTELTASGEILNGILPDSPDAVPLLLEAMDTMDQNFQYLASIEVPEEFSNIEAIADEAASYMAQAASLYHTAYESPEYDEAAASTAVLNYQAAMKRVGYIATLLQGEIPQGADVIMTEGEDTEFEPYSE